MCNKRKTKGKRKHYDPYKKYDYFKSYYTDEDKVNNYLRRRL